MIRFRLTLVVFALALCIPTALLVRKTLDSAQLEQTVRHRAVADRTFDELERVLFEFLIEEEDRPFEAYRFYDRSPDVASTVARRRSPLSYPPALEFIVGYFEIDPRGEVRSPLAPADDQPMPTDWQLGSENEAAIARVREVLTSEIAEWERRGERSPTVSFRQSAGAGRKRTLADGFAMQSLDAKKEANELAASPKPAKDAIETEASSVPDSAESGTAYDLLGKLNRAVEGRVERKQKTQYAPAESLPAKPVRQHRARWKDSSRPGSASSSQFVAEADTLEALGYLSDDADETAPPVLEESVAQKALESPRAEPAAPTAIRSDKGSGQKSARVRITLDPLTSRATNSNHIVLYRTVLVGEQGYRQGLVIDRDALADWLRSRVIDASRLSRALTLSLTSALEPSTRSELQSEIGQYRFHHRFAEPFESLRGDLQISPLVDATGTETIYLLVALLVIACAIGFFALDRMAAIALDFAQRRSNFVAAVSHELRTPLTAIRMYSEMLRDGLVPSAEKQQEYYATMANETERLSRLVENVLEFSRLENGKREIAWQVGDPTALLRETAETLAPHAQASGLRLVFEAEDDCPAVRYDRDAIVQMVFNLVDNAIKYAKKAAVPEIHIRYRKKDGGSELSVRDFGPGVSKPNLRRIFEPFYRAENELTRETKGTGIGLALVRELAEAMGASVAAESPSDGGFRIAITLDATAGA